MELVQGKTIALHFSDAFASDEYRLLQMPDALLNELMASPDSDTYQIRGAVDDTAVLVTADKTFSIKLVESSNQNLLVVPSSPANAAAVATTSAAADADERCGITGSVSCHYELIEILPRLHLLRRLVCTTPYTSDEAEGLLRPPPDRAHFYSAQRLRQTIQASDQQLAAGLDALDAVCIDGVWRVLDSKYVDELFHMVLTIVAEKGWPLNAVPVLTCARLMQSDGLDYATVVVVHVINMHSTDLCRRTNNAATMFSHHTDIGGSSSSNSSSDSNDSNSTASDIGTLQFTDADTVALCPVRIARFRALQLLRQHRATTLVDTSSLHATKKQKTTTSTDNTSGSDSQYIEDLLERPTVYDSTAFLAAWASALPDGVDVDVDVLAGHALEVACDSVATGTPAAVGATGWRYFPCAMLSHDAEARFQALFRVRSAWTKAEITPYTSDLATPTMNHDQLLLRYARAVTGATADVILFTQR